MIKALGATCRILPQLKSDLSQISTQLTRSLDKKISPLDDIADLVERAIADEPPALMKDGGYIKNGFNEELDRLRNITGRRQGPARSDRTAGKRGYRHKKSACRL